MSTPVLYTADGGTTEVPEKASIGLVFPMILLTLAVFLLGFGIGRADPRPDKDATTVATITSGTWTFPSEAQVKYQREQEEKASKKQEEKDRIWKNRPHLSPPADPPPSEIRMGPYVYHVYYTSQKALDTQQAWALTEIGYRRIWLDPNRAASLRMDMLHELMHVAKDLGTNDGTLTANFNAEESEIKSTTLGLLFALRDNPDLVEWLSRK